MEGEGEALEGRRPPYSLFFWTTKCTFYCLHLQVKDCASSHNDSVDNCSKHRFYTGSNLLDQIKCPSPPSRTLKMLLSSDHRLYSYSW